MLTTASRQHLENIAYRAVCSMGIFAGVVVVAFGCVSLFLGMQGD
jgi:intracellular septation protein A